MNNYAEIIINRLKTDEGIGIGDTKVIYSEYKSTGEWKEVINEVIAIALQDHEEALKKDLVGQIGKLHRFDELSVEAVFYDRAIHDVISLLQTNHPKE